MGWGATGETLVMCRSGEPFVLRSQLRYEFFKCREKWRLLRTIVQSRQTSVHTPGLRNQGRGRSRDLVPLRTGLCADWAV